MDILSLVFAFIIILVGSYLQTGFGFGLGPIVVALLPLVLPLNDALVLFLIVALLGNIMLSFIYRKTINWKVLFPILIPTVIITTIIAFFSVKMDTQYVYLGLGFLLIALAIYFFVFTGKIKVNPSVLSGSLIGLICGVCGGFFALAGPGAALYFVPSIGEKKEEYMGTFQMYFLITNIFNLAVRLIRGTFALSNISFVIVGVIATIIGTIIGKLTTGKIVGKWFERGVYSLIGLNGLWIVISHFLG